MALQVLATNGPNEQPGRLGFSGNELVIDALGPDAPKVRIGSPLVGYGGGGRLSFDALTDPQNPDGTRQEMGEVAFGQSDWKRGSTDLTGQMEIWLRDTAIPVNPVTGSTDPQMQRAMRLYVDAPAGEEAFYLRADIMASLVRQVAKSLGAAGRVSRFYSDDGYFCWNCQGTDETGARRGRIIKYRIKDENGNDLDETKIGQPGGWIAESEVTEAALL